LPIKKVKTGIVNAVYSLNYSSKTGFDFAKAIMTTDTKPKQSIKRIKISGKNVVIAGCVKGAGMIGPNMATTLCFITTDVSIKKSLLQRALKDAIGNSLNKLTVDGHQSTNDTAIVLASGAAGNRIIDKQCPRYKKFSKALGELCDDLAKQMAADAEGATRIFKAVVNGAASQTDAAKAARAVADYDLVKCAVHGADPNWGRIICAVGSCGVKLNTQKLSCRIGNITVFKNGQPAKFNAKAVSKIIAKKEHEITVNLGAGKASDFCYGCDLSREYITINADYHT
jgi:glutamate N-acetyltransferase/amino-acid N-acetyltransferase